MALESVGLPTAKMIDSAFRTCHDMVLDEYDYHDPHKTIDSIEFGAKQKGLWSVNPSMLDGKPAVEIRIAVG